jgi:hypothetical protein
VKVNTGQRALSVFLSNVKENVTANMIVFYLRELSEIRMIGLSVNNDLGIW